ncbi:MAG: hypothetical protein J6I97_05935 [Agathobacter sp.]|nr:hypothetical protein [Agathobacter sp.]
MSRQYNGITRTENEQELSTGISHKTAKEVVQKKLCIGQQYRLKSVNATEHDKPVDAVCTLLEMGRNILIFKHRGGMREAFTYQDIWKQMQSGDFI